MRERVERRSRKHLNSRALSENKAHLSLPLDVQKLKAFQLRGLCPWTLLGVLPQSPFIGSRSRAHHGDIVLIIPDLPLQHWIRRAFDRLVIKSQQAVMEPQQYDPAPASDDLTFSAL